MKTLTRNERIFKAKLIAEWGLNKDKQKFINTFVDHNKYTYRELYEYSGVMTYLLFANRLKYHESEIVLPIIIKPNQIKDRTISKPAESYIYDRRKYMTKVVVATHYNDCEE